MQPDANDLSDLVILTVKAALTPALERIASLEARLSMIPAAEKTLTELRDRLVVLETKFDQPKPEPVAPVVDLTPLTDRIATAEADVAKLVESEKALGEMRDRLVTCETKLSVASAPHTSPPVDLAPVLDRLSELKDTMAIKSAAPTVDLSQLTERLAKIESKSLEPNTHVIDLTKDIASLRERMAAVEARQPIPGPQGPKGEDGKDGKDGKNGLDGKNATLEQLKVVRKNEREIEFCFKDGSPVEGGLIKMNYPVFDDNIVFIKGKDYQLNTLVQWDGGCWLAVKDNPTGVPGQGSPDQTGWRLLIKRARDGRDGKDAPTLPVVTLPKVVANG